MEKMNRKNVRLTILAISLFNFMLLLFGPFSTHSFATTDSRDHLVAQNKDLSIGLDETNTGWQFTLNKTTPEDLQFIVTIVDQQGKNIPLFIDENPIDENEVLSEGQLTSLLLKDEKDRAYVHIKYKPTIESQFVELTLPDGQEIQLVSREAKEETTGTQTEENSEEISNDQTVTTQSNENSTNPEESQISSSEEIIAEEEASSSNVQPHMRAAALATGTGSQYVPPGAITISGAFATPNGGAVVSNVSNTNDNGGKPFSQISLSGSNNWTSIWSNDAYKLDFTKSFSQRVYINFGTQQADGAAFVMHNDSRKTAALTNSRAVGVDGQNMGVYGASGGYYELLAQRTPETTAVRNSVAVEFDMYANDAVTGRTRYDAQVGAGNTPHMAYAFPGNLSRTYQPVGNLNNDLGANDWFTLTIANSGRIKHNSLIPLNGAVSTNVQDGTWYEFNYRFDSTTRNFSYSFRNPVTGTKTADVTIPWSDLNSELQLSANNNRAYWGFTAANGGASGQVRFAFTQTPIPTGATVTNNVTDNANTSVTVPSTDTSKSKYLLGGQQAKVQSTIKVNTGEAALNPTRWTTVLDANAIDLASNATLAPTLTKTTAAGATTTITPTNLSTVVTNYASAGVISIVTTVANNALNLSPGDSATLSYSAPTKAVTTDLLTNYYSSVLANPVGTTPNDTNNVTYYSEPVYYWVRKVDQFTTLSWESGNTVTNFAETLDISANKDPGYKRTFYWKDLDVGDTLSFKIKKNNTVLTDVPLSNVTTTGSSNFIANTQLIIPTKYFDYGSNQFVLEVYSSGKINSPDQPAATLNLNVTYTGTLRLDKVPATFKWTNRTVRQSKGILNRDAGNPLELKVWDSRDPRNTRDWSIGLSISSANTSPFSFVWKANPTSSTQQLGNTAIKVFDSRSVPINGYEYTITMNETSGVLLNSPGYLSVGDYSGRATANWKLYNTADIS